MSIFYEADGSVVLRADDEPLRTRTIAAGTPRSEQEAIIVAFFAADADGAPTPGPIEGAERP